MYLSGFTGFNVEMLPRLHKVLLHDSLLWAPEAILRDLTRLFASLGWTWIFWTSCLVATESLHMPSSFQYSPSFFLASPICWRRIHHDLTSFFPPPRSVTPSRSWRPKLNRCRLWWPAHAIASPPWGCCCSTSLRCKTSLGFLGNR